MLCDHLALLLHQLRRHRVDQIEGDRKNGKGAIDAKCEPPDQLFVLAMPEVLEHQEANGQAGQRARQVSDIRDLRTLGKAGGSGIIHKVLCVQGVAQIAGDCKKRGNTRERRLVRCSPSIRSIFHLSLALITYQK